jgi:hypothetical protein
MDVFRVLDHHEVFRLMAAEAELRDRGRGVLEQALLVGCGGPSSRNDLRAVEWAKVRLIVPDDAIDVITTDEPFVHEECLDCGGSRGQMMVFVVLVAHAASR